jgi:uncharacterized protein YjbJ (UPF0337 family)
MKPSGKDEVAGKIHEVKGTVKETVGKLTNDPDLEADGKVEKVAGRVQKREDRLWVGRRRASSGCGAPCVSTPTTCLGTGSASRGPSTTRARFEEALDALQREPIPVPHQLTYLAAILACLGRDEAARGVIRELQTQEGALTVGDLTRALPYRRPEDRDDVAAALRLAGLPA